MYNLPKNKCRQCSVFTPTVQFTESKIQYKIRITIFPKVYYGSSGIVTSWLTTGHRLDNTYIPWAYRSFSLGFLFLTIIFQDKAKKIEIIYLLYFIINPSWYQHWWLHFLYLRSTPVNLVKSWWNVLNVSCCYRVPGPVLDIHPLWCH